MLNNHAKTNTSFKNISLLIIVLMLSGCVTKSYLTRDSLSSLKPGLSVAEVKKTTQQKADYVTTVKASTTLINVEFYRIQTGSRQDTSMICGQYGCNPIFVTVPVIEPFMMLYKENKLIGWGLVEQLKTEGSEAQKAIAKLAFLDYANHLKARSDKAEKESEQDE